MDKPTQASRRLGNATRQSRPRRPVDAGDARKRPHALILWPARICLRVVVPLVLLLSISLGIGYVRLLNGPISLRFLAAPIARSIAADLAGITVTIEDAAVLLTESRTLEFRLQNVRFADADGVPVANAPLAAVRLNSNALWQAKIAPARIILIEPRLLLQYTSENGLQLSFARTSEAPAGASVAAPDRPRSEPTAADTYVAAAAPTRPIDLIRRIVQTSSHSHRQSGTGSYLKGIGLRNATIVFDNSGQLTQWRATEAEFGISHSRDGSTIGGDIAFASSVRPWRMNFVIREQGSDHSISLQANLQDLVPRSIAETLPELAALSAFDFPVDGTATIDMSPEGAVASALLGLDLRRGSVVARIHGAGAIPVDSGRIELRYVAGRDVVEVLPSKLAWAGKSAATIAGAVTMPADKNQPWTFDLATLDGVIGDEFGTSSTPIEAFRLRGSFQSTTGAELNEVRLKLAGGEIAVSGRLPGAHPTSRLSLQGRLSPMSVATLKTLWPAILAPGARRWVGRQIQHGRVLSGSFQLEDPPSSLSGVERTRGSGPRMSVSLEGADVRLIPRDGFPPVDIPRGLVRLDGNALEISAPDAAIVTSPQRRLPLKGARLVATDVTAPNATGELTFRAQGPLPAALELIEQQSARRSRSASLPGEAIDGRFEAQARIVVPLGEALGPDDVRVEAKGRITDGKARAVLGNYDVNGATIVFDVSEQLLDAKGELLVGGVATKLTWQRIFAAADDEQPPLRLKASIDTADRAQLGLDINDLVQGDVPMELTVTPRLLAEPLVQVRADLTNAELLIESLAWKKPPGRSAVVQFDVVKAGKQRTELQNFKVVGDDIAISGTLVIDGQNRVREFSFPGLSVNVVSRLDVHGQLRSDNVWDVKATGATFDGRDFFQSLFSVGQLRDKPLPIRKDQAGLDLKVEVDNVLGYQDMALKGLKLQMSKRGGRLTSVTARGTVDGVGKEAGKMLEVGLQQTRNEPRRLIARSDDAGQVFRLVGFYPNMQGGRMRLDVNLDGSGPAEKTGHLKVESFAILGDPVTYEIPNPDYAPASQRPQKRTERPVLEFNSMNAPFSVGYGQFVLEDADLRGPVLGVVLKGKADFRNKVVDLGGTYVPLQGLNSAIGYFPILGQILAGPRGEGVLGMTFAIQGSMAHPQVLVNPVSIGLPGILREMMQMTNPTPRVTPREDARPAAAQAKTPAAATRSSPATQTTPAKRTPGVDPRIDQSGGWSSETTPSATPAQSTPSQSTGKK